MDYYKIYTNAFNNKIYSAEYHIQYDWVIELLKKKSFQLMTRLCL